MSDSGRRSRNLRAAAVLAGTLVILLGDTGYRLASARYAQLASSTPLPEGTLAGIPERLGDWVGRDAPMDPAIIRYTDTDDHLHRKYVRGLDAVTFYVAYGVRIRDLAPHRPEVCYVGTGWTLEEEKQLEIRTAEGEALPIQIQTFTRGQLNKEQVTVLSYYLVNGVYSADVSGLRWEASRLDRRDSYSAQIQIVSGAPFEHAERLVTTFAAESAGATRKVIRTAVGRQAGAPGSST